MAGFDKEYLFWYIRVKIQMVTQKGIIWGFLCSTETLYDLTPLILLFLKKNKNTHMLNMRDSKRLGKV